MRNAKVPAERVAYFMMKRHAYLANTEPHSQHRTRRSFLPIHRKDFVESVGRLSAKARIPRLPERRDRVASREYSPSAHARWR